METLVKDERAEEQVEKVEEPVKFEPGTPLREMMKAGLQAPFGDGSLTVGRHIYFALSMNLHNIAEECLRVESLAGAIIDVEEPYREGVRGDDRHDNRMVLAIDSLAVLMADNLESMHKELVETRMDFDALRDRVDYERDWDDQPTAPLTDDQIVGKIQGILHQGFSSVEDLPEPRKTLWAAVKDWNGDRYIANTPLDEEIEFEQKDSAEQTKDESDEVVESSDETVSAEDDLHVAQQIIGDIKLEGNDIEMTGQDLGTSVCDLLGNTVIEWSQYANPVKLAKCVRVLYDPSRREMLLAELESRKARFTVAKKDSAATDESSDGAKSKSDGEIVADGTEQDKVDRCKLVQEGRDLLARMPTMALTESVLVMRSHDHMPVTDVNTPQNEDSEAGDDQDKDTPFATTNLTSDEAELLGIYRTLKPVNRPGLLRGVKKLYDEETGEPILDTDHGDDEYERSQVIRQMHNSLDMLPDEAINPLSLVVNWMHSRS